MTPLDDSNHARRFRTRAFISKVIAPRLSKALEQSEEQFLEALFIPLALMPPVDAIESEFWPHVGGGQAWRSLNALLAFEILTWFSEGQSIGYFSPRADPLDWLPENQDRDIQWLVSITGEQVREYARALNLFGMSGVGPGEMVFESMLFAAVEELSEDSQERLRLKYFASDVEWDFKMQELLDFIRILEQRPDLSLPEDRVDLVAWALTTDRNSTVLHHSPSAWREDWHGMALIQGPSRWFFTRARDRHEQLDYCLRALAEMAPLLSANTRFPDEERYLGPFEFDARSAAQEDAVGNIRSSWMRPRRSGGFFPF